MQLEMQHTGRHPYTTTPLTDHHPVHVVRESNTRVYNDDVGARPDSTRGPESVSTVGDGVGRGTVEGFAPRDLRNAPPQCWPRTNSKSVTVVPNAASSLPSPFAYLTVTSARKPSEERRGRNESFTAREPGPTASAPQLLVPPPHQLVSRVGAAVHGENNNLPFLTHPTNTTPPSAAHALYGSTLPRPSPPAPPLQPPCPRVETWPSVSSNPSHVPDSTMQLLPPPMERATTARPNYLGTTARVAERAGRDPLSRSNSALVTEGETNSPLCRPDAALPPVYVVQAESSLSDARASRETNSPVRTVGTSYPFADPTARHRGHARCDARTVTHMTGDDDAAAESWREPGQPGSTTNTTLSVLSNEMQLDEVAEAALGALQHLPEAWSKPVLRALTLQTITEQVSMRVLGPVLCLDAYVELCGEVGWGAGSKSIQGSTSNTRPALSLPHLLTVAPALLQYRVNHAKETAINEMRARYEQVAAQQDGAARSPSRSPHPRLVVPSRAEIALSLLRPHLSRDVVFGAQLAQRVPRVMHAGSRLFLPHATPSLVGNGSMTDNLVLSNSGSARCSLSPRRSPLRLLVVPPVCPAHEELTYAAVSFEAMPSIFLKRLHDGRRQERASHRRRVVAPFFDREFVATLASGNDAACLFSTTLAPEFLVGLSSFLSHPMRALTSAIRATLHRFYNVLTAELLAHGNGTSGRHHLRAPAVDLALLYLRDHVLYFSATIGMEGRLFYLNHPVQRPVVVLAEESTQMAGSSHLDSSRCSATSLVSLSGAAYDMPALTRRQVDLTQFVTCAEETSSWRADALSEPGALWGKWVHENDVRMGEGMNEGQHRSLSSGGVSMTLVQSNAIPELAVLRSGTTRMRYDAAATSRVPSTPSSPLCVTGSRERGATPLPHAVVMATSEFWDLMPSVTASNLLRTMLLLHAEAALLTRDLALALHAAGDKDEPGSPTMTAAQTAMQEQHRLVSHYLRGLHVFAPATQRRLEKFYLNMIVYYVELDECGIRTLQQRLHAQLRRLAVQNAHGKHTELASPPHSPTAQPTRDETRGSASSGSNNAKGNSGTGTPSPLRTSCTSNTHPTSPPQPLCDAMVSVLCAEALRNSRGEGGASQLVSLGKRNDSDSANTGLGEVQQSSWWRTSSQSPSSPAVPPQSGHTQSDSASHEGEGKTRTHSPSAADASSTTAGFSIALVLIPNSETAQMGGRAGAT